MAENYIIARSYAKAIFKVALAENKLPQWSGILNNLALIASHPQVRKFLTDPRTSWQQRADLFIDICGKILANTGKNFVRILALNRRLPIMLGIAEFYEELRAACEGIVKATAVSARTLDKKQQKKLQQALQQRLQSKIALQYEQDKSLLGGIVIRIGDRVIDGSARGKLERLKKCLVT